MSISPIRYNFEDQHQKLMKDPERAMQVWLTSRTILQNRINYFRDRGWIWDSCSLVSDLCYFHDFLYLLPIEMRNQIDSFVNIEFLGDSTSPFSEVRRRMELMLKLLDELIVSKGGMTSYPLVTGKSSDPNVHTSHAKPRVSESTGAGTEDIGSLKRRFLAGGILALCVLSLFWTDYRDHKVIGLSELVALCGSWACAVWLWSNDAALKIWGAAAPPLKSLSLKVRNIFTLPLAVSLIFYIYASSLEHNQGKSLLPITLVLAGFVIIVQFMVLALFKSTDRD
jgi:hypothetical protein